MSLTFVQLGVPDAILRDLARRGITDPFDIQAATVPDALAGRDVCGRAPTGSGKTLAFGIPLVALVGRAEPKRPRALVLAPTRELAEQIATEIRTFAGRVRVTAVYGGVGYGPQYRALRQGVDILVACPGRLEDLIEQNVVDLSAVDMVVIDEADRMADMGFMPSVRRLLDQTCSERQVMLYSATLDGDVATLTRDYLRDPVRHEVSEETTDITAASHVFWDVTRANRDAVVAASVNAVWPAIVFCRTRRGSDRLAEELEAAGIKAVPFHGGRSQNQRARSLAAFAAGKVEALVASDVAARGIHVDGVASVVHYDPPEDAKTYFHRSGRTARAGQGGVVLSLVLPGQSRSIRRMQYQLGLKEPFIQPDPAALRRLSPSPVWKKSGVAKPTEDNRDDLGRSLRLGSADAESRGAFDDHDDRRGDTLPYRTRQEQAADPRFNPSGPSDRRSTARQGRDSKPDYKSREAKPPYASGAQRTSSKPPQRSTASPQAGFDRRPSPQTVPAPGKPVLGSKPFDRGATEQAGTPEFQRPGKRAGRSSPSREARRLRRHPELANQ